VTDVNNIAEAVIVPPTVEHSVTCWARRLSAVYHPVQTGDGHQAGPRRAARWTIVSRPGWIYLQQRSFRDVTVAYRCNCTSNISHRNLHHSTCIAIKLHIS